MTAIGESRRSYRDIRKLAAERPLYPSGLNQSMQHLDSKYREEDVVDEAKTENLLQR